MYEISEAGVRGEGTMGTFVDRPGENARALRIETEHRDFIGKHEISDPGGPNEIKGEAQSAQIQTGRKGRLSVTYRRNLAGRGGDFIYKEQYGGHGQG